MSSLLKKNGKEDQITVLDVVKTYKDEFGRVYVERKSLPVDFYMFLLNGKLVVDKSTPSKIDIEVSYYVVETTKFYTKKSKRIEKKPYKSRVIDTNYYAKIKILLDNVVIITIQKNLSEFSLNIPLDLVAEDIVKRVECEKNMLLIRRIKKYLLEVGIDIDFNSLTDAKRKLAKMFHPDLNDSADETLYKNINNFLSKIENEDK